MDGKRPIIFSVDKKYIIPFKVFISSLIKTKSISSKTELYVLYGSELGSRDKKVLTDFGKDYSLDLNLISMINFIPKNLPIEEGYHLTESTYYRLFCHKALPKNIKSALYLDCDMLAIDNIGELLDTELSFPIGAVDHLDPFNQLRINGEKSGEYFNAGVLIIDLDYWRKNKTEEIFLKTISDANFSLYMLDQDILNIVFQKQWQRLPYVFNVTQTNLPYINLLDNPKILENSKQIKNSNEKVALKLIHFDGSSKPWIASIDSINRPYAKLWLKEYRSLFKKNFSYNSNTFLIKYLVYKNILLNLKLIFTKSKKFIFRFF